MERKTAIGWQSFEAMRNLNIFYVDKTGLIKEWWDNRDAVTLITRPRRFGKTLNLDMLNCFFSNKYANCSNLFEGLSIWEDERFRKIQGTYINNNGVYDTYWADTSGNGLISSLIQKGTVNIKQTMEQLLMGESFETVIDEQIVFNQLDSNPEAIWSLMVLGLTGMIVTRWKRQMAGVMVTCSAIALGELKM